MRKIFVAAFAFVGFIFAPAIASARPPAPRHQVTVSVRGHQGFERSSVVQRRVEASLKRATFDLNRAQRQRLIGPREASIVRAEIRNIRAQLRQSLRRDGRIDRFEARRLDTSVSRLEQRVADAFRHNRPGRFARR